MLESVACEEDVKKKVVRIRTRESIIDYETDLEKLANEVDFKDLEIENWTTMDQCSDSEGELNSSAEVRKRNNIEVDHHL